MSQYSFFTNTQSSTFYANGQKVGVVTASVINNNLNIIITPLTDWVIPNKKSLNRKDVSVGEVLLGFDEGVSLFTERKNMWYRYINRGSAYRISDPKPDSVSIEFARGVMDPIAKDIIAMSTEKLISELTKGAITSIPFLGVIIWEIETVIRVKAGPWYTDLTSWNLGTWGKDSTSALFQPFFNDNAYDQRMIVWSIQDIPTMPAPLINFDDSYYLSSPNNILIKIPLAKERPLSYNYINVYVKLLVGKLIIHERQISVENPTYVDCKPLRVPIN